MFISWEIMSNYWCKYYLTYGGNGNMFSTLKTIISEVWPIKKPDYDKLMPVIISWVI